MIQRMRHYAKAKSSKKIRNTSYLRQNYQKCPQIGDFIPLKISLSRVNSDEDNFLYLFGTVVYINQNHHWFTAEFQTIMGQTFRESFDFQE